MTNIGTRSRKKMNDRGAGRNASASAAEVSARWRAPPLLLQSKMIMEHERKVAIISDIRAAGLPETLKVLIRDLTSALLWVAGANHALKHLVLSLLLCLLLRNNTVQHSGLEAPEQPPTGYLWRIWVASNDCPCALHHCPPRVRQWHLSLLLPKRQAPLGPVVLLMRKDAVTVSQIHIHNSVVAAPANARTTRPFERRRWLAVVMLVVRLSNDNVFSLVDLVMRYIFGCCVQNRAALLVETVSNAAGFWVRVVGAVVETAVSHELAAPMICVTIVLVMPEVAHLGVDAK